MTRRSDIANAAEWERYQAERRTRWGKSTSGCAPSLRAESVAASTRICAKAEDGESACRPRKWSVGVAPGPLTKYRNVKTDGFDSAKEAKRFRELLLLQFAGTIRDVERQPSYLLIPAQEGERACHYIGDFRYVDVKSGETICEDVKGVRTPAYVIKRKLLLFVHGVRVREI